MSDPNLPGSPPPFDPAAAPAPSWDAPPPPAAAPGAPAGQAWTPPPAGAPVPVAPAGSGGVPGILDPAWQNGGASAPAGWAPKQKMVAGILGILIGSLGIHSFYLGNSKKGIIQIVASVLTCGLLGIWGFIEGIMILIGNIKTDAYGIPLTD